GRTEANLKLDFPLLADLPFEVIDLDVTGRLFDVAVGGLIPGHPITAVQGHMTLDNDGLNMVGRARLSGVPVDFDWTESFMDAPEYQTKVRFDGVLDEAARNAFGLDTGERLIGAPQVKGTFAQTPAGATVLALEADLTHTALDLGETGIFKPKGIAASARATLDVAGKGGLDLREMTVRGPDFEMVLSGKLGADGAVRRLDVSRLKTGVTDCRAVITFDENGGYTGKIEGAAFDVRPLAKQLTAAKSDEKIAGPSFDLTLDLDRLWLADAAPMTELRARIAQKKGRIVRFDADAMAGSGLFSVRYNPKGDEGAIRLQANDAGAALGALGIFDHATGGTLAIEGTAMPNVRPLLLTGTIHMRGFRITRAPWLIRLLNIMSIRGFREAVEIGELTFETMETRATWRDGLLSFQSGQASGAALGLTFAGTVDLNADTMDMEGTIVPVQSVNRVFGAIPVFGEILTGGEGEGMFAATYTIQGAADDPKISVDPLSALAPGMLRDLFKLGKDLLPIGAK
ncbi:MAG: AsmA-like C-terminal domain-containing protein, partial [Pseudomonadota bacterium]|nr:AsmA-like C-terminal domain-containing protein [Pseudomonadota bacterium]